MKLHYLLFLAASFLAVSACDRSDTTTEKVGNKVDDALDRRPAEKLQDASEDAGDAVKDASQEIKEAVKDATE